MTELEIPRCKATSTQTGERCRKRPIVGGDVCYTHGGSAPQVKAKAAERVLEQQVAREIGRQGWAPVSDPVGAYADNAGEVLAFKDRLRERVETLDDWTLRIAAFGASDDEADGKQLMAMGEQVRAYVAAYERALDRAERTLARMIQLGLDAKAIEARITLINRTAGEQMGAVVLAAVAELGLSEEQQARVPGMLAKHFRSLVEPETGDAA
ncbi:MAG TPA: hypothetical protein VGH54_09650 [Mycobacterium sp.]|jgi:hypothetical protein|uniref:hypothetical protein n=1 Tax=Mycobacterium sp. TaxID=1785 RepID=UPI002F40C6D0